MKHFEMTELNEERSNYYWYSVSSILYAIYGALFVYKTEPLLEIRHKLEMKK